MKSIEVAVLNPEVIPSAEKMMVCAARLTQRGHKIKSLDDFMALYSVTYEKDGGTGDVPVDATMYADGEIVQLSKSYSLTKSSKSQIGWALSSGGNAVDTVTIAGADVKVYPVFEA